MMPYINGRRVSNQEWIDTYGSIKQLHTGPNGENPGKPAELDEETGAPPVQKVVKRAARSAAKAKAAVADAMGKSTASPEVAALDADGTDKAEEGGQ
jgi:hypothetical protein